MHTFPAELDQFVKSLFHVIIFKKQKDNVAQLRALGVRLVRVGQGEVDQCILSNASILLNYLKKGRQIEKALLGVHKIMRNSAFLLENLLPRYLDTLAETKNSLMIQSGLKFVYNQFNSNNLKTHPQRETVTKIIVQKSSSILKNIQELKLSEKSNKSKHRLINL